MHKIVLEEITVRLNVGVTENEKKNRQKINLSIELHPAIEPSEITDNIENTVNYSSVRVDVKKLLKDSTYNLIETVAYQVAGYIKDHYQVTLVRVTVKKYPYRDTKAVSYTFEL
jgi:dihydroneopterin aldolase